MDLADALATGTTIAGVLGALRAGAHSTRGWYRRGPGSRRTGQARLNRLGAGMTLAHTQTLLGPPVLHRRLQGFASATGGDGTEGPQQAQELREVHEWVHRTPHAWVQLLSADGDVVVRVAITVTDPRFALPVGPLTHGVLSLRLVADTFAAGGQEPEGTRPWIGARRSGYLEWFYAGNPGNYQRFALAWNDASTAGDIDVEALRAAEQADLNDSDDIGGLDGVALLRARERVRRLSRPNTVAVGAPMAGPEVLLLEPVGVDLDHVRVLPQPGPAGVIGVWSRLLQAPRPWR